MPVAVVISTLNINRELRSALIPDVYDMAAIFAKQYLSPEERSKLVVVGSHYGRLHLSSVLLDNAKIARDSISTGAPYDLSRLPAGKEWILVIGDHALPENAVCQIPANGFTLTRLTGTCYPQHPQFLSVPTPAGLLAKHVMPDDVSVRAAATVEWLSESPDLKGYIDGATRKDASTVTLSGWAADLSGSRVTVLALVDGKSVMNVRTSGPRPDVVRALGLPATSTPDLQFNGDALCSKGATLRLVFVSENSRFGLGPSQPCP